MSKRLAGRYGYPADDPFRVTVHEDKMDQPMKWKKGRMIFVCSMGDLFHKDVRDETIDAVVAIMAICRQHRFQLLTKRPDRAWYYFTGLANMDENDRMGRLDVASGPYRVHPEIKDEDEETAVYEEEIDRFQDEWPFPNIWIGTSVENQKAADERIPHLLKIPAAVRFLSCEPLLGPIKIGIRNMVSWGGEHEISWVICGGESGPGARPMNLAWARSIKEQCADADVAYFFKQVGGVHDARSDLAKIPVDLQIREYPGGVPQETKSH